jgi:hypothetical protein
MRRLGESRTRGDGQRVTRSQVATGHARVSRYGTTIRADHVLLGSTTVRLYAQPEGRRPKQRHAKPPTAAMIAEGCPCVPVGPPLSAAPTPIGRCCPEGCVAPLNGCPEHDDHRGTMFARGRTVNGIASSRRVAGLTPSADQVIRDWPRCHADTVSRSAGATWPCRPGCSAGAPPRSVCVR